MQPLFSQAFGILRSHPVATAAFISTTPDLTRLVVYLPSFTLSRQTHLSGLALALSLAQLWLLVDVSLWLGEGVLDVTLSTESSCW